MYRDREQNATQINATQIREGRLDAPLPAYSRERLVIEIADRDATSVYAIVVRDEAGNASPLSNAVSAKLVYVPPNSSVNVGMIVGIVVGSVAFLAIIGVIVAVVLRKRKNHIV